MNPNIGTADGYQINVLIRFEDTIKLKAELIISVIENQYLAYGNDIMRPRI